MFRENCLSCCLSPILKCGAIIGFPLVWSICQHSDIKLKFRSLKYKPIAYSSLVLLLIFLSIMVFDLVQLHKMWKNSEEIQKILIRIPIIILYAIAISTIVLSHLQINTILRIYQHIQDVLEDFQELKLIVVMTSDDIARFRTELYFSLTFAIILIFAGLSTILHNAIRSSYIGCLEAIGILLVSYNPLIITLWLYYNTKLFKILTKKYQNHLQLELRDILNFSVASVSKRLKIVNNKFVKINIANSIASYTRLHYSFFLAFRLINKFINPMPLIWIIGFICTAICIVVQDVLIIMSNKHIFFSWPLTILNLLLVFISLIVIGTSRVIINVNTLNDDMMKFLLTYPISNLCQEEALQVEVAISTLKLQTLSLNGSQILPLKLPMYGSIVATVIMYVCSALQIIKIYS